MGDPIDLLLMFHETLKFFPHKNDPSAQYENNYRE